MNADERKRLNIARYIGRWDNQERRDYRPPRLYREPALGGEAVHITDGGAGGWIVIDHDRCWEEGQWR